MEDNERLNSEDFIKNIGEMSRGIASTNMAMGAQARRLSQQEREEKQQHDERQKRSYKFNRGLSDAENNLRDFTASGDAAIGVLNRFATNGRGFLGLSLFTILASQGVQLSKSWQELTNIGQTFGGSMFSMLQQAGAAGLSLEEFANISKKNNLVMRATGGNYMKMQKELRRSVSASGSFGYSVEQLNDFLGSNLEVSRRNGTLQSRSSQQVVADMGDLMNTTTALASASDKTRDEILQLASAAMSSSLSIAQISNTPLEIRGIVDKSVREATMGFAALPGEAGQFFSQFFNDTLGATAALTDQGQTLINAGMSGLASEMDAMAGKFRSGQGQGIDEQIYYQDKIIEAYKNNLPMLQAQAASGNESAKQFINMASALSKMTKAELAQKRAQNKNAETMTAFLSSLNSMFGILKGSFFAGFVKSFEKIFGKMDAFGDSPAFKNLEKVLEEVGAAWGTTIATLISGIDGETFKNGMIGLIQGIVGIGNAVVAITNGINALLTPFAYVANLITGVFSGSIETLVKGLTMLVAGIWAYNKVMSLKNMITGQNMNIKANVVNIDGPGGGGADNLGRRGGKRSRTRRIRAGGRNAARRGGSRLGGMARGAASTGGMLGKGLGKSFLKKIPVLGLLAGLGFAGERLLSGDLLGAGGELASGAAGAIPGVGTAASIAIDGGLAARDAGMLGGAGIAAPSMPEAPKTMASMAAMAAMGGVGGLGGLAAGLASKALGPDPQQVMIEEMKRQTTVMTDLMETLNGKLEQANRLLSKIEVSAQGIN